MYPDPWKRYSGRTYKGNAGVLNEKWTTDVTEFKVPGENKKLYLGSASYKDLKPFKG